MQVINFKPRVHKKQILTIFKSHPDTFPEREIKMVAKELKTPPNPNHLKLVAIKKEAILGYLSASRPQDSKNSWLINWLAIAKKEKRKGIGTLLIKRAESKIKAKNALQIFIETCSCPNELPARKLYKKLGYKKVATLPDFYARGYSKVFFRKK